MYQRSALSYSFCSLTRARWWRLDRAGNSQRGMNAPRMETEAAPQQQQQRYSPPVEAAAASNSAASDDAAPSVSPATPSYSLSPQTSAPATGGSASTVARDSTLPAANAASSSSAQHDAYDALAHADTRDMIEAVRAALRVEDEAEAASASPAAVAAAPSRSASSSSAAASSVPAPASSSSSSLSPGISAFAAATAATNAAWFNLHTIHQNEMRALPEFFSQQPPSGHPTSASSSSSSSSSSASSARVAPRNHDARHHSAADASASASASAAAAVPASSSNASAVSASASSSSGSSSASPAPVATRHDTHYIYNPFRTPQVYKDLRDWMYVAYHCSPTSYLHVTTCMKFLVADFGSVSRIHSALEQWQLINIPSKLEPDTKPAVGMAEAITYPSVMHADSEQ